MPLLIIATFPLADNEVLVDFSDGSAAVFATEELEKLRPIPKRKLGPADRTRELDGERRVGLYAA